jgi:hypothetical protein
MKKSIILDYNLFVGQSDSKNDGKINKYFYINYQQLSKMFSYMLAVSMWLIPIFATFLFPINPPKRVIMYHMTSRKSAQNIMKHGFDPKRARTKAFGAGINVSSEFNEVLRYAPDDEPCIIFCIVTYHRGKPNESDVTQMIHEVCEDGAEVWYSKPTYMHPPPGFDALYCDDIYVFPSSAQVIPIFFIQCQKLLPAN